MAKVSNVTAFVCHSNNCHYTVLAADGVIRYHVDKAKWASNRYIFHKRHSNATLAVMYKQSRDGHMAMARYVRQMDDERNGDW